MEIAFVSSNKIYLEIEKKQDSFISKILTKLTEKPSQFIVSMLIGNTIVLVVYSFFMGELLMNWIESMGFNFTNLSNVLIQTSLSTIIVLITSEFIPKVFFQIYANHFIKFFALPAYLFYLLFYFIAIFILWISDFILKRFFKTEGDFVPLFFSKVELGNYITEQMSTMEDHENMDSEIQIFQNALEFSGVKARDIMTPRTEISAVEIHDSVTVLKNKFIETGYSKILVYQNSLDDILGYVHSFELFKKPRSIKSVLIPIEFVPETILIKDVLEILTKKRKSIAIVLDEYGGTSGMITVEDIVEELFGEIEDEHDLIEEMVEKRIEEDVYLFSARLDVEYLNQTYKLQIPESDSYGTLGGFIVNHTSEIPVKGDQITVDKFRFTIEEATNKKIEVVKLIVLE
jgi:CBS domain containing-hemolysin-like protein